MSTRSSSRYRWLLLPRERVLLLLLLYLPGGLVSLAYATEMFIASVAHRISRWLAKVGRRFNQACGGVFVVVGALLPLRT